MLDFCLSNNADAKTAPTLKEFPKGNPVNSHDVAFSYIFFFSIYLFC